MDREIFFFFSFSSESSTKYKGERSMKFYLHPFRDSIRCFKKKKRERKSSSTGDPPLANYPPDYRQKKKSSERNLSNFPCFQLRIVDLFRTETKNGQTTKEPFLTISIIIQKNIVKISMLRDPNYRPNRSQKRR